MALNVQILNMKTDDFAPSDLFGNDKYEVGDYIRKSRGKDPSTYRYLGSNTYFSEIRRRDRAFNDYLRGDLEFVDYTPDHDDLSYIEEWRSFDDMRDIGRGSHLNIMTYKPVRDLAMQGRISGFGYGPEGIPEEDTIGRMIANGWGTVEEDGNLEIVDEWISSDPEFKDSQLDLFEKQRRMIDLCLSATNLDPTDTRLERF